MGQFVRGLQFQTHHEDVQDLFWRYGFYCQCEKVVKKGLYHPYKNNRCSACVWVLSADVDAMLQTKMKQGGWELELKDAVDNGKQLEPPHWLVRVAARETVTCLHHLPCRTPKLLFTYCRTSSSYFPVKSISANLALTRKSIGRPSPPQRPGSFAPFAKAI